jgi:Leucine-rich repeat (LRR) protein
MIRTLLCVSLLGVAVTPPLVAEQEAKADLDSLGARYFRNNTGDIIGVDLSSAWLTDADLEKLARLPQLETINLAYTKITDLGLEHLAPLKNVKVLDLYYAEAVSDLGIAHLKHWKNLEHLNVRGTKVTSTLFEHVAKMTRLKFLDVGHSRVNDDLFEVLDSLPHLEHCSFGGNKMSGAALPLLKSFPALKELSVSGQQRTDSGLWSVSVTDFNIGHIAQLPRLRQLKLWKAKGIDDAAVPLFLQMKQLEALELPETNLTYPGLTQLAANQNQHLKHLFLGGLDLTPEQLDALGQAMPNCRISWWTKPTIEYPDTGRRFGN